MLRRLRSYLNERWKIPCVRLAAFAFFVFWFGTLVVSVAFTVAANVAEGYDLPADIPPKPLPYAPYWSESPELVAAVMDDYDSVARRTAEAFRSLPPGQDKSLWVKQYRGLRVSELHGGSRYGPHDMEERLVVIGLSPGQSKIKAVKPWVIESVSGSWEHRCFEIIVSKSRE